MTILIKSGDNYGSKKSIKRQFESDLSQNFALGWLHRLSLVLLLSSFDFAVQLLIDLYLKLVMCSSKQGTLTWDRTSIDTNTRNGSVPN